MSTRKVARALISVSDKAGVVDFGRDLERLGVALLATGGTHRVLANAAITVTDVATITGFPEIMNGRVKTLHPKIHGGILARRDADAAAMTEYDVPGIDLVAVNLYPFQRVVARLDCTLEEAVENIDIGGPAMLRSAAKNHHDVLAVVDPGDYREVVDRLQSGGTELDFRLRLAVKAFAHTAAYDAAIADHLRQRARQP